MDSREEADLARALDRFDDVMGTRHPSWLGQLRPGLDDAGIDRLRQAVAPWLVPSQVEALYRWHDGGDSGVFGGWRMRPVEELVDFHRFTCEDLEGPGSWLPVFDDHHLVTVVTLDVPGVPPSDLSVWCGHTHDDGLDRLFDSVAALLDVVSDAAQGGALAEVDGRLGLPNGEHVESLDGPTWSGHRLARSPGAYRHPDPPAGTTVSSLPAPDWPRAWLLPLGITDESLVLRGPTHTVAELVAAAADRRVAGAVEATIRGRVVRGVGGSGGWDLVVDDGTGSLLVVCATRVVPILVPVGTDGEFDVLLETAVTPEPVLHDDPVVAAAANRVRPPLPTAHALGARRAPTTG